MATQDETITLLRQENEALRAKLTRLETVSDEQESALTSLQKTQARFAGILDIANEAIISINEAYEIVLFNQGAEQIFGYAAADIMGRQLDELIPPRFRGAHTEHIDTFHATDITARLMGERREIFGLRRNGEEFPALASISKLELDSETVFTVVLRDITSQKKAETERNELSKQVAVLEERQRFAQDLHDGIIQAIYGVGLALDQVKADLVGDKSGAARQIDAGLKSLAGVIQDLRNYIFDLRPQAMEQRGNLQQRLDGLIKELRVNTSLFIHPEITPMGSTNLTEQQERHLFHIAHEALSNAARHAKANRVDLYLGRHLDAASEIITLKVKDNGCGFDPTPQIRPGHRGLSNIQTRVGQLGAELRIESAPGQGTCITITLRLSPTA